MVFKNKNHFLQQVQQNMNAYHFPTWLKKYFYEGYPIIHENQVTTSYKNSHW